MGVTPRVARARPRRQLRRSSWRSRRQRPAAAGRTCRNRWGEAVSRGRSSARQPSPLHHALSASAQNAGLTSGDWWPSSARARWWSEWPPSRCSWGSERSRAACTSPVTRATNVQPISCSLSRRLEAEGHARSKKNKLATHWIRKSTPWIALYAGRTDCLKFCLHNC